jgi:hypothetical protein
MSYETVFKPRKGGDLQSVINEGKRLIYGNTDYSSKVKKLLKEFGNERVKSAKVIRVPLSDFLVNILNVVSFGDFKKRLKETEYDKLFHLAIVFETDKGPILVEKNEVINLSKSIPSNKEGYEEKRIATPNQPTLNEILKNTQDKMQDRFFKYSAYDNNCQNFILSLLKSNNLGDESDYEFVKQDTEELFKSSPYLRKLSNTITDIASRVTGRGGEDINPIYAGLFLKKTDSRTVSKGKVGGLVVKENPYNDW